MERKRQRQTALNHIMTRICRTQFVCGLSIADENLINSKTHIVDKKV